MFLKEWLVIHSLDQQSYENCLLILFYSLQFCFFLTEEIVRWSSLNDYLPNLTIQKINKSFNLNKGEFRLIMKLVIYYLNAIMNYIVRNILFNEYFTQPNCTDAVLLITLISNWRTIYSNQ